MWGFGHLLPALLRSILSGTQDRLFYKLAERWGANHSSGYVGAGMLPPFLLEGKTLPSGTSRTWQVTLQWSMWERSRGLINIGGRVEYSSLQITRHVVATYLSRAKLHH